MALNTIHGPDSQLKARQLLMSPSLAKVLGHVEDEEPQQRSQQQQQRDKQAQLPHHSTIALSADLHGGICCKHVCALVA